jgi:hypothetical protein
LDAGAKKPLAGSGDLGKQTASVTERLRPAVAVSTGRSLTGTSLAAETSDRQGKAGTLFPEVQ